MIFGGLNKSAFFALMFITLTSGAMEKMDVNLCETRPSHVLHSTFAQLINALYMDADYGGGFHQQAVINQYVSKIKRSMKDGADIWQRDDKGASLAMKAAFYGIPEILQLASCPEDSPEDLIGMCKEGLSFVSSPSMLYFNRRRLGEEPHRACLKLLEVSDEELKYMRSDLDV